MSTFYPIKISVISNNDFYLILYTSEPAAGHVEGGIYISPEFLLGQVYDGAVLDDATEVTILYRPVYVCVQTPDDSITQATPSSVVRSAGIRRSSSAVPDVELSTTSNRSISLEDERRQDNDDSSDMICHGISVAANDGGGTGFQQSHTSSPRSSKTPIGQNGTTTCLPPQRHQTPLSSPTKLSLRLLSNCDDVDTSSSAMTAATWKSKDGTAASTCSAVKETDNVGVPMITITTTAAAVSSTVAKSDGLVQKHPVMSERQLERRDKIIGFAENEALEFASIGDELSGRRSKPVEPSTEREDFGKCVAVTNTKQNCRPDQLLLSTAGGDRCCVRDD